MSHLDTKDFPNWFFRFDELDLLELQYEALYDERGQADREERAIKDKVLSEQEQWEEKTQEELERLLGDTELEGEAHFITTTMKQRLMNYYTRRSAMIL